MAQQGPILYTGEGDDGVELPYRWAICGTCCGEGKHSLRFGAITQEDRERDWDVDSWDDYMSGRLDAGCEGCDGTGKVKIADRSRMTAEQVAAYDEQLEDDAAYEAERAAEIRMGC